MSTKNTDTEALSSSEAMNLIKSLQGSKKAVVPLVIDGQLIHEGIEFAVSIKDYNDMTNAVQGKSQSMTAAASTMLKRTVIDDHKELLTEALKVVGMTDYFIGEVLAIIKPVISESLD